MLSFVLAKLCSSIKKKPSNVCKSFKNSRFVLGAKEVWVLPLLHICKMSSLQKLCRSYIELILHPRKNVSVVAFSKGCVVLVCCLLFKLIFKLCTFICFVHKNHLWKWNFLCLFISSQKHVTYMKYELLSKWNFKRNQNEIARFQNCYEFS